MDWRIFWVRRVEARIPAAGRWAVLSVMVVTVVPGVVVGIVQAECAVGVH